MTKILTWNELADTNKEAFTFAMFGICPFCTSSSVSFNQTTDNHHHFTCLCGDDFKISNDEVSTMISGGINAISVHPGAMQAIEQKYGKGAPFKWLEK